MVSYAFFKLYVSMKKIFQSYNFFNTVVTVSDIPFQDIIDFLALIIQKIGFS